MHPYAIMFFALVILICFISAGILWIVEELWWLLLAVAIIAVAIWVKQELATERWLGNVRATEIIAIDGIQREVYAHKGYSTGLFGYRTNYYERTLKEVGRMVTFRVYYVNGMTGIETVKEGTHECRELYKMLKRSNGPQIMDTTPIFRDHEEW